MATRMNFKPRRDQRRKDAEARQAGREYAPVPRSFRCRNEIPASPDNHGRGVLQSLTNPEVG